MQVITYEEVCNAGCTRWRVVCRGLGGEFVFVLRVSELLIKKPQGDNAFDIALLVRVQAGQVSEILASYREFLLPGNRYPASPAERSEKGRPI